MLSEYARKIIFKVKCLSLAQFFITDKPEIKPSNDTVLSRVERIENGLANISQEIQSGWGYKLFTNAMLVLIFGAVCVTGYKLVEVAQEKKAPYSESSFKDRPVIYPSPARIIEVAPMPEFPEALAFENALLKHFRESTDCPLGKSAEINAVHLVRMLSQDVPEAKEWLVRQEIVGADIIAASEGYEKVGCGDLSLEDAPKFIKRRTLELNTAAKLKG